MWLLQKKRYVTFHLPEKKKSLWELFSAVQEKGASPG